MKRRIIPTNISDETLFRADHTCCICRTRGKDVQIHHINGDNSSNNLANLAVLCLDCHSKVTGTRGLGKAYTYGEVRRYKLSWDQAVQRSRGVHRPKIKYQKELISQIDLIVCETLAVDTDKKRVGQLLEMLIQLHIWRGNRLLDNKIIEGLSHLALMGGLGSKYIAPLVADKLWEMCWHYVGPKEVPMTVAGQRYVLKCIDALDTLADFNFQFGRNQDASKKIVESVENFLELAIWYSRKPIAKAILKLYKTAQKSCLDGKPYKTGKAILLKSLRRTKKALVKNKKWNAELKSVNHLIKG